MDQVNLFLLPPPVYPNSYLFLLQSCAKTSLLETWTSRKALFWECLSETLFSRGSQTVAKRAGASLEVLQGLRLCPRLPNTGLGETPPRSLGQVSATAPRMALLSMMDATLLGGAVYKQRTSYPAMLPMSSYESSFSFQKTLLVHTNIDQKKKKG